MNTKHMSILALSLIGALGAVYVLRGKEAVAPAPADSAAPAHLRAEGRVAAYPGADVVLGTDLGGTLVGVFAEEGQRIRRGQRLVQVDPRSENASQREAAAKVKEQDADIVFLEREAHRQSALHTEGVASRQAMEQTRAQLDLALARRDAARATSDRLGVTLSKLRITAPFDGVVLTRLAQPGETVSPGASLLRVARLDRIRVEAEIDEFDLSRVKLSTPVRIRTEGLDRSWRGHVEELPNLVVGRRLKPQDPARPSDTRVMLVKVALDEPVPFKLGQRVELEIEP